MGNSSKVINAL